MRHEFEATTRQPNGVCCGMWFILLIIFRPILQEVVAYIPQVCHCGGILCYPVKCNLWYTGEAFLRSEQEKILLVRNKVGRRSAVLFPFPPCQFGTKQRCL